MFDRILHGLDIVIDMLHPNEINHLSDGRKEYVIDEAFRILMSIRDDEFLPLIDNERKLRKKIKILKLMIGISIWINIAILAFIITYAIL